MVEARLTGVESYITRGSERSIRDVHFWPQMKIGSGVVGVGFQAEALVENHE